MTSPISPKKPQPDWDKLVGGKPLGSREYRYRQPNRNDIIIAIVKIILYGTMAVFSINMIDNAVDGFRIILGSLIVLSGVMVLDAIFGGLYQTSLNNPTIADLFFPMQNASWGLFPGPLLFVGGIIGVFVGTYQVLF